MSRRPCLRAITILLAAATLVYVNTAVISHMLAHQTGLVPRLPLRHRVAHEWWLFGVFSSRDDVDRAPMVDGQRADGSWVRLDDGHYLHQSPPNRLRLLWGARLPGVLTIRQRLVQEDVLRRMRARYNAEHPEAPIGLVRSGVEVWPRHPDGYEAGRTAGPTTRQHWCAVAAGR